MSNDKLYIGQEKGLTMLIDEDVIDATMTVTNADDTDYSFAGITDINMLIWDHQGGPLLDTLVMTDNLTVSSNIITLNVDYSADMTGVTLSGIYYFKITWNDASARPITVRFGNLKMI